MPTIAFVDIQNLFYGVKRTTGDPTARVDYVKLIDDLRQTDDDMFLAYVVTPVINESMQPSSDRSWLDDGFVRFLKKAGYAVRRHYARVAPEGEDNVRFERTSPASEMFMDAMRWMPSHDRVLIVSGSGSLVSIAEKARAMKKPIDVACFARAGDLNRQLATFATNVIRLDATYKWQKRGGR